MKDKPFTAILCSTNQLMIGAWKALRAAGKSVPRGCVTLIGFDDIPMADACELPFTVVRQDPYHIGYYAAKTILQRISIVSK